MFGFARYGRPRSTTPAIVFTVAATLLGTACLVYGASRTSPAPAPLPTRLFSTQAGPDGPSPSASGRQRTTTPAEPPELQPARVYVPSIGVDGGWVSEPTTAQGLVIPADVHTAGLSLTGGQPNSSTGTVLLASHVNYIGQGAGMFATLYQVQPGALVILTDTAGRASRWRITGLDDPLKPRLDPGLFTAAGPRRLALITCGGKVIRGEYERNVVATAIPEPSGGRS